MRLIFVITFLLSLPLLVIAHRQHYFTSLQGPLFVRAGMALDAPEFAQVDTTLNYMDVTLKGVVADLATREKARKLVDDLPGLRCREQDNLIQVTARLNAKLSGNELSISGWLHDEAALRDVTQWLEQARPGIEIDTQAVKISPYVTIENIPRIDSIPAAYRSAWTAIEVPASLTVIREGKTIHMSGALPAEVSAQELTATLKEASLDSLVDAHELKSGVYVQPAKFANAAVLATFLKSFFSSPGAMRFTANASKVQISGQATPSQQGEWLTQIEPVAVGTALETELQLFPSIYHFPGRSMESRLAPDALRPLEDVLRATTVNFGQGYATPEAGEQPKLVAAAAAIIAAGPETRIIIGGHVDASGDPKDNQTMARRRAENVAADLVAKGVPPQSFEVTVFEPVPGGTERSRQVELMIK